MDTMEKVDVQLTTFDVQGTLIFALKVNMPSEIKITIAEFDCRNFFLHIIIIGM